MQQPIPFVPTAEDYRDALGDDEPEIWEHRAEVVDEQAALARLDGAWHALAQVRTVRDALDLSDRAAAIQYYLKRSNAELEVQNEAASVRLLSKHRAAKMISEMPKQGPGEYQRDQTDPVDPSLSDLGIGKGEATQLRALAELDESDVQTIITDATSHRKEITVTGAVKKGKEKKRQRARAAVQARATEVQAQPASDRYHIACASVAELTPDRPISCIITDPPYPREYLPVYADLAAFAARALPDGGSLFVMVGQSYIPEILALMTPHIRYHWTLAYLTPGGQAVQLWQRNVNTFWKPILWFVKGDYRGKWAGDVIKSSTNDNDKRFHHWGQSESGMAALVNIASQPGDVVCDPFCGGGTTGVVALSLDRLFVGADIDQTCVDLTSARCLEALHASTTGAERLA